MKSDAQGTAEGTLQRLVGQEHIYALGHNTPGRKQVKPGDWLCFYATGTGVIGHARVCSEPEYHPHPTVRHPDRHPWIFHVDSEALYPDAPVVVDGALRSQLDAFASRNPHEHWSFFVKATHKVTEHDFTTLTRRATMAST